MGAPLNFASNVQDALAFFDYLNSTAGNALQDIVQETSEAITPLLRAATPIGQHFDFRGGMSMGGGLRDSLRMVVGDFGAYLAGAEYGRYVIAGTRPHPIRPKARTALAFYWQRVGKSVVRRSVMHPGTKPNDFRQKGLQEAFDSMTIQDTVDRALSAWVTGSGT